MDIKDAKDKAKETLDAGKEKASAFMEERKTAKSSSKTSSRN